MCLIGGKITNQGIQMKGHNGRMGTDGSDWEGVFIVRTKPCFTLWSFSVIRKTKLKKINHLQVWEQMIVKHKRMKYNK